MGNGSADDFESHTATAVSQEHLNRAFETQIATENASASNAKSDASSNSDANAKSNAKADENSNSDAKADANSNSDATVNSNANANATIAIRASGSGPCGPQTTRHQAFECPRYSPKPGSKRCEHYVPSGHCQLPEVPMCVEWLRRNPGPSSANNRQSQVVGTPVESSTRLGPPAKESTSGIPQAEPSTLETEVKQNLIQTSIFPHSSKPEVPKNASQNAKRQSTRHPVLLDKAKSEPKHLLIQASQKKTLDESIESFKKLGIAVCISTAHVGKIWIVPEYTGRSDRTELSIEHADVLSRLLQIFPGSLVTDFCFLPSSNK